MVTSLGVPYGRKIMDMSGFLVVCLKFAQAFEILPKCTKFCLKILDFAQMFRILFKCAKTCLNFQRFCN